MAAYMSKNEIKTLQRLLNLQGANLLVDGIKGPKTKDAMEAFENGLLYPNVDPEPIPPDDDYIVTTMYEYTRDVLYGEGSKEEPSEEVKHLQAMLKYQGFGKYLGKCGVDGICGYGTRKGVEEYVRGRGLNTPAIEKTGYRTITKEIWEMFHLKPYDVEDSIFTDEYMKCNCNGKYCDGTYGSYGVSYGLVMLEMRLEEEVQKVYGPSAKIRLTDDVGKNGGLRCDEWNRICGGANKSTHEKWIAADTIISGVRNVDYKLVQEIGDRINPYGGCSENYSGNIHMDTRGYYARW